MFTCMVKRDWSIEGELMQSCCEIIRCVKVGVIVVVS